MHHLQEYLYQNKQLFDSFIVATVARPINGDNNSLIFGKTGEILSRIIIAAKQKDREQIDAVLNHLEEILSSLADSESFTTNLAYGAAGIAYLTEYIHQLELLDIDTEFLSQIDDAIIGSINNTASSHSYDLFNGLIGTGIYFLRNKREKSESGLKAVVENLLTLCSWKADEVVWLEGSSQKPESSKVINFGMAHGLPSIIIFLSKLSKTKLWNDSLKDTLLGTIRFALRNARQFTQHQSHFPEVWIEGIGANPDLNKMSWCYGDFGMGFALIHAYEATRDMEFLKLGESIILNLATRKLSHARLFQDNQYVEPCFCHGSIGNAYLFFKAAGYFQNANLELSCIYWLDIFKQSYLHSPLKNLQFKYDDGPAQTEDGWVHNVSLLEGSAGISLILSEIMDNSNSNWDEIFLLNI